MKAAQVLQELNKDFETAAEWLLFYEDRLRQWEQDSRYIREEIAGSNMDWCVTASTGTGDGVVYKVISIEELERQEKWLLTVELVHEMLSPKKQVFLAVRRAARRKNQTVKGHEVWRGYVQTQYAEDMAKKYGATPDKFWLTDKTITEWWRELVELTRCIAYKRGCGF
ncbi:MAG TPA: hypothetical protein VN626_03970 [Clostridia bacterium]|nr:hypothetical protein [Clostridia bacterium]